MFKKEDNESKRIWELFRKTEEQWCCKFLQEMAKEIKITHLYFSINGESAGMKINYCPRCGRKISDTD